MKNILIFSACCLALLTSCQTTPKTTESNVTAPVDERVILTDAQFKNAHIITGKAQQEVMTSILKVNGKIDVPPQNLVSVSMPLGGYLKTTHLMPGTPVKKGEVLAVLEDQQYIQLQQDYLTTKTKLAFAEQEYERQKELNQTKASSDKVYQTAESEFRMLQISLSALAEKLRLINLVPEQISFAKISRNIPIYSPITGFVSKVNVNIGKYVSPSDVLFELINTSDIHLNLKVFEKDIDRIRIGQRLYAFTNVDPEKKYPCSIILISRDLDQDGSVEVHCHFDKYDHALLPGMYMNALIETKNDKVFTLPESAVVYFEGKNYVFVAKGDKEYLFREVQTGIVKDGKVAVYFAGDAGMEQADIVLDGAYTLLMTLKNKADD
ncbi:MAG: efflux RND transporter periplasmic adaptor subunit [Chitinophagales bacterium]